MIPKFLKDREFRDWLLVLVIVLLLIKDIGCLVMADNSTQYASCVQSTYKSVLDINFNPTQGGDSDG